MTVISAVVNVPRRIVERAVAPFGPSDEMQLKGELSDALETDEDEDDAGR